jgi:hypothetical protein
MVVCDQNTIPKRKNADENRRCGDEFPTVQLHRWCWAFDLDAFECGGNLSCCYAGQCS